MQRIGITRLAVRRRLLKPDAMNGNDTNRFSHHLPPITSTTTNPLPYEASPNAIVTESRNKINLPHPGGCAGEPRHPTDAQTLLPSAASGSSATTSVGLLDRRFAGRDLGSFPAAKPTVGLPLKLRHPTFLHPRHRESLTHKMRPRDLPLFMGPSLTPTP